jgi:tetratricopeptide (TPR) repeat protein
MAVISGWTEFPDEALKQAEGLRRRLLSSTMAIRRHTRCWGAVYFNFGQLDVALSEVERAIALNPNDAGSYAARGADLVMSGHPKEAIESFEIAMRLNPSLSSSWAYPVGWAYHMERRYEKAVTALKAGLRASPSDYSNPAGLAASYAQLGRMNEAVHAAEKVRRLWPFFDVDDFVAMFYTDCMHAATPSACAGHRALIAEGLHKAGLKVTYVLSLMRT